MEKQYIAFAHYRGDELLGFRQDTFGTIGKNWAKLYVYSKDQVEIVMNNIRYAYCGEKKPSIGELLGVGILKQAEERIYEQGQEARAFEVRVVKAPAKISEKEFDVKTATWKEGYPEYDVEAIKNWLEHPEDHETIETHQFSMMGQLPTQ